LRDWYVILPPKGVIQIAKILYNFGSMLHSIVCEMVLPDLGEHVEVSTEDTDRDPGFEVGMVLIVLESDKMM
jgi:hypothetical protein